MAKLNSSFNGWKATNALIFGCLVVVTMLLMTLFVMPVNGASSAA